MFLMIQPIEIVADPETLTRLLRFLAPPILVQPVATNEDFLENASGLVSL